jgi:hypothetical protein
MTERNLASLFPRPTDQERERRRAVLLLRAAEVQRWGWDDYRHQWSTGEVLAVAAILGDREIIIDLDESFETVYRRWAYDLWGMADAQNDEADDLRATRNWFAEREREARRVLRDSEFEKSLREIRGW